MAVQSPHSRDHHRTKRRDVQVDQQQGVELQQPEPAGLRDRQEVEQQPAVDDDRGRNLRRQDGAAARTDPSGARRQAWRRGDVSGPENVYPVGWKLRNGGPAGGGNEERGGDEVGQLWEADEDDAEEMWDILFVSWTPVQRTVSQAYFALHITLHKAQKL